MTPSAARRGRLAAGSATLAMAVTCIVAHPAAAHAQAAPAPAPTPSSQMRLTSQTTWVGDGGTFQVGLAVTTPDAATARLQLTVYQALSSRSDFTESLADRIHSAARHVSDAVSLTSLGPSPELSIAVNPKPSAHVTQSVHFSASGVYPVRIDLIDADGNVLSRLTTHLVYSTADAASTTRLEVAWVALFRAPPPTGPSTGLSTGLSSGVSSNGVAGLANLSGALTDHPSVAATVAATPQTVDALANGSPAERATTTRLAQAVADQTRQLVASPYVPLDVPAMLAAGLDGEIATQLATGAEALTSALHIAPAGGTWIATGSLSAAAVDDLAARGVRRLVVADNTLTSLPADDRTRTLAQPFVILGKTSRVAGAAVDEGLAAHFVTKADRLLAAHQLLADLALVQLEFPNRRGGRGVVVVPPSGWQPDPTFLATFLDGLASAPTLSPVTVDRLFADVTPLPAESGQGPLVRGVAPPDRQPKGTPISDGSAIRAIRRTALSLSAVVPASAPVIPEVDRKILTSESADISDRARPAAVAAAAMLIERLKAMVRLPGDQSITFTARQGLIPITILSSAPYPLRVRMRVSSQKLGFRAVGLPGGDCTEAGTSEVCTVDLRAQNTTIRVPVVAKTAGVFSLTVALDSPDGGLNLATNQDTVRSTAASGVGVLLSIGAALLLAVWWVRNVLHGRRARRLVPREQGWAAGSVLPAPDLGLGSVPRLLLERLVQEPTVPDRAVRESPVGESPVADRPVGERPVGPVRWAGPRVAGPVPPWARPRVADRSVAANLPDGPSMAGPRVADRSVAADLPDGPRPGRRVRKVPPIRTVRPVSREPGGGYGPGAGSVSLAPPAGPRVRPASWDDQSGLATQPIPIIPVQLPSDTPGPAFSSPPAHRPQPSPAAGRRPPAAPAAPAAGPRPESFSRNTAVMAAGTLLSRVTGFGRVVALIWAFGITTGLTDVYIVANTAPNIVYDLVLGGILSATLVPVFVDYLGGDDPDEAWRAISAVITAITVTLIALSAIFWFLAPAIIRFYQVLNNSASAADGRAIGAALLHMFVPQLFLLGGIAVTTALLNARRHFAAPAFAPVVNNLVVIGAIVAARLVASSVSLPGFRHDQSALLILGLGTTAGYLFQFLVQLPPLRRAGFRLRPVWDLRHPAVRTVLRLSLWTFGSVIANQISFNLILVLADHRKGDVAVFTTAYQFFQLPYAIFAVSIASVITPDLSEQWSTRDLAGFRRQMAAGVRLTMSVMVPAALGYVVLGQPFLQVVLRHGSFSGADTHRFGAVVALFAAGLPGFSAYLLLMRAYQAMQDTRSMFWLYLVENAATLLLAGALYPVMGVGGLALGWVGAYTIGSIAAFAHLRRRTGGLDGQAILAGLVRVAAATALMILPVFALTHLLKGHSELVLLAKVVGGVVAGGIVYLAAAQAFGIAELTTLLRRRTRAARP